MRTPLTNGTIISSNFNYIIDSVAGEGASSIVYHAHYQSEGTHSVILKECYPYDIEPTRSEDGLLCWNDETVKNEKIDAFKDAYKRLLSFQNGNDSRNSTVASFHCFEANNTVYSATLLDNGVTFDKDNTANLTDILKTILALTKVVSNIHNAGYLHLDIKPENFLVIPETRELVRLFDFDTVTSLEDIRNGKIKAMSYSQGWSAPEQAQGNISKLSFSADIYAIGAILFYKIFGRKPDNADRSQFATWDFDGEMFDEINPKVKRLLSELFRNTISANPNRRINSANLINNLEILINTTDEKQYIVSDSPVNNFCFVGREDELETMHEKFEHGTRAIFLHGFGGMGKSSLAKEYAIRYEREYDVVLFRFYRDGLKSLIERITIENYNEDTTLEKFAKQCKKSKTLLIVDNFDVDGDDLLDEVLKIDADLIFTTRNDYSSYFSGMVSIVETDQMSTTDLIRVFKNEYAKVLTQDDVEVLSDVIEHFDNWTYLVPKIAKYLISSGESVCDFAKRVEEDGLVNYGDGTEKVRDYKDGVTSNRTLLDHLRYLFDISKLSTAHLCELRNVFILRKHRNLSKSEYKRICQVKTLNILNDLVFLNWVQYDPVNDVISLQPVMEDLISSDLEITPENVPGIYNYICSQFENLDYCKSIDDAHTITLALVMYSDIDDSHENMMDLYCHLTQFALRLFYTDIRGINNLIFSTSDETDWSMNTDGVLSIMADCITSSKNDEGGITFGALVEYFVFCIAIMKLNFELDSEGLSKRLILIKDSEDETPFGSIFTNIALIALYSPLRDRLCFDRNGVIHKSDSWNIGNISPYNYQYYYYLLSLLKTTLQNYEEVKDEFDDSEAIIFEAIQNYHINVEIPSLSDLYDEFNEILILVEISLGNFSFWIDHDEMDISNIDFPNPEDFEKLYESNKKKHWTKNSTEWFASVDTTIASSKNPFAIYRLLLSYEYNKNIIKKSKTSILDKNHLISRILFDDRLDATQKSQLLFFLPCTEILKERFPKTKRHKQFVIDRFDSLLRMYAQGISCYSEAIEKGAGNKLNNMRLYAYGAYVYLKRTLGIDLFDFETCIRKDISPDNIKEFDSLLQIADRIRQCGLIKLSQSLKNQMLDILEQTDFENASVELKEMIDYCFLPLSANYKRTEVVNKIKGFSLDVEDQYHLKRLKSKNEPAYKKIRIATDFLDKYITVVAELYYHNTKHDAYSDVTDYENLLEKYHSELLDFAKNTEFPWYYEKVFNGRDSFPNEKMFYHIFPHPVYNEGDFETFNACAGLCFMLADDFDFLNKQHDFSFEEQLCELLSVAKSENRINEISDVLSTIIQKNPNAKDGIDTFIRECKNSQDNLTFVY